MFKFFKVIKRSFDSSSTLRLRPEGLRSLRMTLGESGVIQLIPLLLILAGILAGVYLVQKSGYQIFKPKATGASIQFIDHSQSSTSCVTTKDNKQVTTCPTIQFKLTSPLENQSFNSVPGLVSTAYAHDEGLDEQESRTCTTNGIGMHVVRSSKPGTGFVEFCWPGAQECRTYQFEDGHDWARCVRTTFPPCDGEIDWERGRDICKPKAQPAEQPAAPQGPAPECSNDTACVDGNACTEDSCQDGKCVYTNSSEGKVCNFATGATCDGQGQCLLPAEPTPAPTSVPAPTRAVPTSRPPGVAAPEPTPEETSPQPPQGGAPTCITGPAGAVTVAQAQCVINLRSDDILPFYQKNNWCIEGKDYPGIINNWMGINNQADKDQVKGCFEGVTRVTKKYRVSENRSDLENTQPWQDYSSGMTVTYTFQDKTPDLKFIWVQFLDDQGNVINASPFPAPTDGLELVAASVPAEPTMSAKASCDNKVSTITWSWTIPTSGVDTFNVILPSSNFTNNPASSSFREFTQRGATAGQTNTGRIEVVNSAGKNLANASVTALDCSAGSPTPTPASNVITGSASCSGITVKDGKAGSASTAKVSFSGEGNTTPAELKIWIASNSEIGKSATDVTSWTPLKTISIPESGREYTLDILSGFAPGTHAVLMSLHGPSGLMLDGNPGGKVNPSCVTTINIQ